MFKRFASIILALVMVLGVFPTGALAENLLKPTRQRADIDDSRMYDAETGDQNLFSQNRGNLGESDFQGAITFTYNGSKETPEEILAELTAGNKPEFFIPSLTAPSTEYTVVKTILRNGNPVEMNNVTINSINLPGGTFKMIEFMPLRFVSENELCNAFDEYTVIWTTENGVEHTDVIRFNIVFFEENQGGNEPERQPSNNSGENGYPDAVTIEISSALDGVLFEYDPETGAAEFVIAENDPEDWQTAYVDEGAVMSNIYATVIIQAPDWAVGFNGANGGDYFLEEFIERTESEDNEFYPVRNGDPYYRSNIELAHITRNETAGKVTVSLMEENLWTHLAWVDQGGNIVYQSVNLISSVVEGTTEIYTFDDAFANVQTIAPEDFNNRIEINEITSNQMTEEDSEGNLNYNDGILTLTYTGEGTDYESVKDSFVDEIGADGYGEVNMSVYPPAAGYKPYKMEFSSGLYNPKENDETLPVWGMFYGEERVFNDDEYYLYWISEDGSDFIIEKIGISFKFPFKNIWMEKYWKPLSYGEEDSRLKITVGTSHSTAVEYTLEELEEKGAIITIEDGYIAVSFADNADIYTITNIIAQVEPPEGAVYYKRNNSSAPNLLDYKNADDQNAIILSDKTIRTIAEDGKPRLDLSGFDVYEVNGLDVYVSYISGITRVQIIDWYNANNEIIQRDYYYSVGDDYCVTQVAEAVEEENLGKIEAPTPVLGENDANWKLTTNHYPQTKENENVNAYYFQLEGDENTPEGDKVVYLPYSFIDPELDYNKALDMKLKPKIHHYTDDHSELVEGKPIDGELRPEGIRFVVGSFSPFVLAWEKENHEFGETAYEWSEDGKGCEAKRVCLVCEDHTETEKAEVTGKKVKEPTCTEKGQTEYTAVFEADWAEDQKKTLSDIPETGHRWDKGEIVEEPTCTEEGTRLHTCLNDKNHTKEEDIPVDRDAHSFGRWKTVIKATEDREGKRVKICSECGKKVYEIIPMKDGNAIIISGTEREEDEENPNTGAAAFSEVALVSVIGAAGVFLLGKKR